MVFILNSILGNNFKTVDYIKLPFSQYSYVRKSSKQSINDLIESIDKKQIDTLFIIGGNPAYNVPKELDFAAKLSKVKDRIHLTSLFNESSYLCNWVIPRLHYLESWNDLLAYNGAVSITQPVIKRTVEGLQDNELLNLIIAGYKSDYSILKSVWNHLSKNRFDKALHNGYIYQQSLDIKPSIVQSTTSSPQTLSHEQLELSLYADDKVYDGRFSNNGWLQEVPDAIHKTTWGNVALVAPRTAKKYKLKTGDVINIVVDENQLEIPVLEAPGQAINSISIAVGYEKLQV